MQLSLSTLILLDLDSLGIQQLIVKILVMKIMNPLKFKELAKIT